jgi:hypothetical protein
MFGFCLCGFVPCVVSCSCPVQIHASFGSGPLVSAKSCSDRIPMCRSSRNSRGIARMWQFCFGEIRGCSRAAKAWRGVRGGKNLAGRGDGENKAGRRHYYCIGKLWRMRWVSCVVRSARRAAGRDRRIVLNWVYSTVGTVTRLRSAESRVWVPSGANPSAENGSGIHRAALPILMEGKSAGAWSSPFPHVMPALRMRGAIPHAHPSPVVM